MRRASLFRQTINDFRFVTLIVFVSITAMICVYTRAASKESVEEAAAAASAQRRGTGTQTRRRAPAAARPRVDYSKFSHATKGHFENCASCHLIPSFEKPDIADYPDHPACINCHRQQFFRGARPVICSNCHTVTAPRGEARFKFPKANEPTQFVDLFPHAKHFKSIALKQFVPVVGKKEDEKVTIQETCLHCHKLDETVPKMPANTPKDDLLPSGTFMRTPTTHATCFACHWKEGEKNREQPPFATQCDKCHRNESKPLMQTAALTNAPTAGQPPAARTKEPLKIVPAVAQITQAAHVTSMPLRISPKFVHNKHKHRFKPNEKWKPEDGDKVPKEVLVTCTQCHAGVRSKAETRAELRSEANRVQLLSCSTSACHTALSGTAQLSLSVFGELKKRNEAEQFKCDLCHTAPINMKPVPCSHYTAVLVAAQKENEALEKAGKRPKTLTALEKLIPPRCKEAPKKEGS